MQRTTQRVNAEQEVLGHLDYGFGSQEQVQGIEAVEKNETRRFIIIIISINNNSSSSCSSVVVWWRAAAAAKLRIV